MRTFINVEDIGPLEKAMAEAMEIKNDRYKYQHPYPPLYTEGSHEFRHECDCA